MAAYFTFIPGEVYVVLYAQAERRQLQRGRVVRVPLAHQPIFPATLLAQSGELVLAQNVSGEAVRVSAGLEFGIRDQVDLAVRLLKGLADVMVFQPASPVKNGLHGG